MKENDKPDKFDSQTISNAIQLIFKSAIGFASGLIGLFGIICLVGWSASNGYFSKFGAVWLTNSQSISQIVGFSSFPMGILILFLFVKVTDIYDKPDILKEPFFLKYRFRIFLFLAFYSMSIYLINKYIELHSVFEFIGAMLWVGFFLFTIVETFTELIFGNISKSRNISEMGIRSIYVFGVLGLFIFPYLIGAMQADFKVNPDKTSLPIVKIKGDTEGPPLRFLFKSESHVYAAEFKKKGPPYNIKFIPVDKIDYIEP